MSQNVQFGTGLLYGVPNSGNLAANPTPQTFGILQEASVEFKGDLKKLFGQKQFPVAKARGKIEVMCKAKFATQDVNMVNQLYWGQTAATGGSVSTGNESHTPSASVAVTHVGTFSRDLGVINGTTGAQMVLVASGPVENQYTQTAGTYTFYASETAATVLISYEYTVVGGTTVTLANQMMGFAPEFTAVLSNNFRGKNLIITLNNCTMSTMSLPTKQEDFWIYDIAFEACTDATDTLGTLYSD